MDRGRKREGEIEEKGNEEKEREKKLRLIKFKNEKELKRIF